MKPSTPPRSRPSAKPAQYAIVSSDGGAPRDAGPIATSPATRSGSASASAVAACAPPSSVPPGQPGPPPPPRRPRRPCRRRASRRCTPRPPARDQTRRVPGRRTSPTSARAAPADATRGLHNDARPLSRAPARLPAPDPPDSPRRTLPPGARTSNGRASVAMPDPSTLFDRDRVDITTGSSGAPEPSGLPCSSIASTTSNPSVTSPSDRVITGGSVCLGGSTTKNWLPERPGGSTSVFAIATTPCVYAKSRRRRFVDRVAGARPGAGADGSPGLDHEPGDDAVKGRAVEDAVLGQILERGRGLWAPLACRARSRTCRSLCPPPRRDPVRLGFVGRRIEAHFPGSGLSTLSHSDSAGSRSPPCPPPAPRRRHRMQTAANPSMRTGGRRWRGASTRPQGYPPHRWHYPPWRKLGGDGNTAGRYDRIQRRRRARSTAPSHAHRGSGRFSSTRCAASSISWPLGWDERTGAGSTAHLTSLAAAFLHVTPAPERVLDLGTGTGEAALLAAREFPRASVRGIDVSEEMIADGEDEGRAGPRRPHRVQGRGRSPDPMARRLASTSSRR